MKRLVSHITLTLVFVYASTSFADFRGTIKPVNVRDDDGSYQKEPSSIHYLRDAATGRWTYTVLWRDAYVSVPGDRGGRHGGVDIDCDSGTPVYAIADGYINFTLPYNLENGSSSWGGTVILEVGNVPGYGTVYFSYHHLRAYNPELIAAENADPNGGAWVPMGYLLGYSGGLPGDPMHGFSSGDHLDFRCNRTSSPWYPSWPDWTVTSAAREKFRGAQVNVPDSWDYYVQEYQQYDSLFSNPPQTQQGYEATVPPVANSTYDPMQLVQQFLVEVGERENGSSNQRIVDCWHRNSGAASVGVVYADNGTLDNWNPAHIHSWGGYECQTYQNGQHISMIMDNPPLNRAYWIHGGFWQMFRYNNGPTLYGPPRTDEISNWTDTTGAYGDAGRTYPAAQEFDHVVMLWNGTQVLVRSRVLSVHIMIVPGTGVVLTGWPLSATEIYLTTNDSGAARYSLYRDASYVGDMVNFELVDQNLTTETTYAYQLIAFNVDGSERGRSPTISLTTPAGPTTGIPAITLTAQGTSTTIELSWTTVPGTSWYEAFLDGRSVKKVNVPFCTVYTPGPGTYQVQVKAFNSQAELLAQSSVQTVDTNQNILIVVSEGPSTVGPNETFTVSFDLINDTDNPVSNFHNQGVSISEPDWIPIDSTFPGPGTVPAHSRARLATFQVETGDFYPVTSQVTISVSTYFDCNFLGHTSLSRSQSQIMTVVPFVDLLVSMLSELDTPDCPVTITNEANSPVGPSRLELWANDSLIVSVLVPGLGARESWQQTFDLSSLPAGSYEIMAIVDPDDEITESIEDNNEATTSLIVHGPPTPTPSPSPTPTPTPTPLGPPDLQLQAIGLTPLTQTLRPNQVYVATVIIKNAGIGPAGSFSISANYWGKLYVRAITGLAPGQTYVWTMQAGPIKPVCGMRYGIVVTVDPTNTVSESNETNNRRVGGLLTGACP